MTSELIDLSIVIGDIYDAAINPALWQQALSRICAFVGGSSAVLFWQDSALQRGQAFHLYNEDPYYTKLYFEKYLPMNPVFPAATFMESGVVHTANDIIPQQELEQTRFYKEWIAPQGIVDVLAVNLEKGATHSSLLNIRWNASDGMVDEAARKRLAALVPHLQRAVAIGKLLDQRRLAEEALTQTLDHVEAGVFLVGGDGVIVFTNDKAKALLNDGKLVRQKVKTLQATDTEANRILRDVFSSSGKGDESVGVRGVAVPLSDGSKQQWFAHVLPLTSGHRKQTGIALAAVAAVFIRKTAPDAPPPLESIAKVYKLTASEVRVLDAMLKVTGVKAMAERLGVSQATVRTHLHKLFSKTGARRQSELLKLVAGM